MAGPYQRPMQDVDNGIASLVIQMDPPRYLVSEAAALVGRSKNTLIKWRKRGICIPSETMQFGETLVYLYTDRDIANMRMLTSQLKPGRPRGSASKAS
jgi:MerR HTH family regulatory protein